MARMKRVFASHREVCHVWAQQVQAEGRASNVFFEGDTIYSYGYHFAMARILSVKGQRVALVTTRGYSMTTSHHKSLAWGAVRGLMPAFASPDISNPRAAVRHLDAVAKETVADALRRRKVEGPDAVGYALGRIAEAYAEATALRKILGLKPLKAKASDVKAVKAHYAARLKRYRELNSPEMLARKEAERQRKAAAEQAKAARAEADAVGEFRLSGYAHRSLERLPHELLHVRGDRVLTSRGAAVSLVDASKLYRVITSATPQRALGQRVGSFTVNAIDKLPDGDTLVTVGCHRILLSEAARVFGNSSKAPDNVVPIRREASA